MDNPKTRRWFNEWFSKIWIYLLIVGILAILLLGAILGLSAASVVHWQSDIFMCPGPVCDGHCDTADDCPVLSWNTSRLYTGNLTSDVVTECLGNGCVYSIEPCEGGAYAAYVATLNSDDNEARRITMGMFEETEFNNCLHSSVVMYYFIYFFDCAKPDWCEWGEQWGI
jgi:hypothetical protein